MDWNRTKSGLSISNALDKITKKILNVVQKILILTYVHKELFVGPYLMTCVNSKGKEKRKKNKKRKENKQKKEVIGKLSPVARWEKKEWGYFHRVHFWTSSPV